MAYSPMHDPFFDDVVSPVTSLRDSIAEVVEDAQSRPTENAVDLSRGYKEVDNPKGGSKSHWTPGETIASFMAFETACSTPEVDKHKSIPCRFRRLVLPQDRETTQDRGQVRGDDRRE